jgi:hypothetical protein
VIKRCGDAGWTAAPPSPALSCPTKDDVRARVVAIRHIEDGRDRFLSVHG